MSSEEPDPRAGRIEGVSRCPEKPLVQERAAVIAEETAALLEQYERTCKVLEDVLSCVRNRKKERLQRAVIDQFIEQEERKSPTNVQVVGELCALRSAHLQRSEAIREMKIRLNATAGLEIGKYVECLHERYNGAKELGEAARSNKKQSIALKNFERKIRKEEKRYKKEKVFLGSGTDLLNLVLKKYRKAQDVFVKYLSHEILSEDLKICIRNGIVLDRAVSFRSAVYTGKQIELFCFCVLEVLLTVDLSRMAVKSGVFSGGAFLTRFSAVFVFIAWAGLLFLLSADLSSFFHSILRTKHEEVSSLFYQTLSYMVFYWLLTALVSVVVVLASFLAVIVCSLRLSKDLMHIVARGSSCVFCTCVVIRISDLAMNTQEDRFNEFSSLYRAVLFTLHVTFMLLYYISRWCWFNW